VAAEQRAVPRISALTFIATLVAGVSLSWGTAPTARAEGPNAIVEVPGAGGADACRANILPRNDDGSTTTVGLPFTINFFGNTFSSLYVNNNGNVTFTGPLSTFTPFSLAGAQTPIIAPFFADVDTRGALSDVVRFSGRTFGHGMFAGRPAFCANWVNVGYYFQHTDKLNSFQLLLVDRSDIGVGDFDIYFNYDKIQWETGDASGGSGGFGGSPARVGFSNGTTQSFELAGSGVTRALLDSNTATGLIHNSRNTTQRGRYIFPVRGGAAPTGGTLRGTVFGGNLANPLAGAFVQACRGGACNLAGTNALGQYSIGGLAAGMYDVRASPPAGTQFQTEIVALSLTGTGTLTQDFVLRGPTPLPAGTTITNRYISAGGIPVLYWGDPLTLTTTGCVGGTASYQILQGASVLRSGSMTEGPAGTYTATVVPLRPSSGAARVVITIICGGVPTLIEFDVYIDPSGTVRTTAGVPIAGATVTLFRSDTSAGPFAVVPNGDAIMSPVNRNNPDTTDAAGHFGWDVITGFYRVRASATGCTHPTNPSQTFVESAVLAIPPPVTDLDLRLRCPDTTPPTTTATAAPLANAAGWNSGDVTVTLAAVDNTGGSGVRDITYSLSGAQTAAARTVIGSTASTTITAQGTTTLTYFATDNESNGETPRSHTIRIDRTAPEAFHRFDPVAQDLAVFGRDALSGPAIPFAIAPLSVITIPNDDDDEDDPDRDEDGDEDEDEDRDEDETRVRRTYRIEDRAGNSLVLVELVKREGHELKAQVESLRYNDGAPITPARNKTKLEWALKAGALKELEQKIEVGRGRHEQEVEAEFEAKKNRTTIKVEEPEPERKIERPGLVLLRLATDRGMLRIEFD